MLQVFKSIPVVRDVTRREALPPQAREYPRDTLTLGWEDRLRARRRRRSDGGLEFGTALQRGTVLSGGDCFVLDGPALVVEVIERPEPVFIVEPQTAAEWALFAYYIGNSHQPVMITDRAIVCADLPGMALVLEQHGIAFTRSLQPFTPVGVAADDRDHRHQP